MLFKKLVSFLMMLVTVAMLSSAFLGCHTIQGAGEDIQEGGEAIQRSAE